MSILDESQSLFDYTQLMRRNFHQHPELGFQEQRTAGIVFQELTSFGLQPKGGIAETGIQADLAGSHPGPCILLRADMDALPIQEETGLAFASENPGVMHACGHDAHTAVLLSVAKILCAHRQELHGSVRFMFQPAEEGMGGAEKMIAAGILEHPRPEIALAVHVWNEMPTGTICIGSGPVMAGAEIFKIRVIGQGGHGAIPQLTRDPILAAAQIVTALQGIVARNVPPLKTAVVSVCTIHAGEIFNVIPQIVEMTGTIRTFDPEVRQIVLKRFEEIVASTAQAMGCSAEISIPPLTPATVNDPKVASRLLEFARNMLPGSQVIGPSYITMGSEDFAYVLDQVPGCFIFVGTQNSERGYDAPHHHPRFNIDEAALPSAVALLAGATLEFLKA